MPSIPYDPGRAALLTPAASLRTFFSAAIDCSSEQLAVEAARLAYLQAAGTSPGRGVLVDALSRVKFGPPVWFEDGGSGTQAFGTYRSEDDTALLAFRGTQPDEVTDIQADLAATLTPWTRSAGRVHRGFASRFLAVHDDIRTWLDGAGGRRKKLILCGHSLGAALATLAASIWTQSELITIGSPRVGDTDFVASLAGVKTRRFVNCCDIVTQVPPKVPPFYVHAGRKAYIVSDGTIKEQADSAFVFNDRMQARANYIVQEGWKAGAVLLRDLADHSPVNYARALFP